MASKPKRSKTYILHELATGGRFRVIGRYRVGAKNEEQAKEFLRGKIGKHKKVRVYYEEKNESNFIEHGTVMPDIPIGGLYR